MPELIVTRKRFDLRFNPLRRVECDVCAQRIVKAGVLVNTQLPDGSPLSEHLECAECYSRGALDAVTDADLDALTLDQKKVIAN